MKRWLLFVLLFGLLIATVMPVSAAGNGPRSIFTLAGKVTAIAENTVTIEVLAGNRLVKPYLARELVVTVTDATRFLFTDGTVTMPITFEDLKVGDAVSAHGTLANAVWTASRITVGANLIHHP